jgi:hypothetical protein
MKRFRVKIVGLGLALAAGSAVADDGEWRAPGAVPPGAPELLPPALRAAPPDGKTIWLPARAPAAPSHLLPASAVSPPVAPAPAPPVSGAPAPTPWPPVPPGTQGRYGPLPPIPPMPVAPSPAPAVSGVPSPDSAVPGGTEIVVPLAPVQSPVPEVAVTPTPRQPDAVPPPRPIAPTPATSGGAESPPMKLPVMPESPPPPKKEPLPNPRPFEEPAAPAARGPSHAAPVWGASAQPALPPAPPELMYPAGALEVHKHGTFGSPPIRLSRDFGTAHDAINLDGEDTGASLLSSRAFVRGEYLLWWLPGFPVPVLATTNRDPSASGFFGEPGTTAITGPGALVGSTRSGFRVRAGLWFTDRRSYGIDAGFFTLGDLSETAVRTPDQFPTITRPFFAPNARPGSDTIIGEFGEAVSLPGLLRGTLTARGDSRFLGTDVNLRACLFTDCNSRAEFFVGYRYLSLRERLTLTEDITVIGNTAGRLDVVDPVGTRVVVRDQFATRNAFHGGQVGVYYERQYGRWDIDTRASVGLGTNYQTLTIGAIQVRQRPGMAPMTFTGGGLLAAGPNIGSFDQTRFSVVPELTLNVGYRVTPRLRAFAGYNFLLWTNVIRPGDQIDRVVDLTFVPNAPAVAPSGLLRPRPPFVQRDLAVNGVQFGLDFRW